MKLDAFTKLSFIVFILRSFLLLSHFLLVKDYAQPAIRCSKLTKETQEQAVKYVQS